MQNEQPLVTGVSVLVSHPNQFSQLAWDALAGSVRKLTIQTLFGSVPTNFRTKSVDLLGCVPFYPRITKLVAIVIEWYKTRDRDYVFCAAGSPVLRSAQRINFFRLACRALATPPTVITR